MSKVYFIKTTPDAIIPKRANSTDAGMDIYASEDIVVPPNAGRRLVSTGLKIGISPDKVNEINCPEFENEVYVWQAEVTPRSGLAWKKGVTVLNSPGIIDNSYRGLLKVIVVNHGDEPFKIEKGDRIAQLIITKSYILPIEEVEEFSDETNRGEGGFGSSGK